jgi:hypothetical protein
MNRLRLLGREDGIALVMALGILMVLSITLTSIIYYTSSSSRDASRTQAGQKAYALAEAALNNAAAQIAANYYDASGTPTNTATPGNQGWISSSWTPLGTPTQQQQSPSSTSACTVSSSCMQWIGTWCPTPYTTPAACTSLPAPALTTRGTWVITGKGTMPNPTGPNASSITRTVQATIEVSFDPKPASIWQWLYSGNTTTISQKALVKAPLWVRNTLSLQQSAAIEQPQTTPPTTGNRLVVGFDRTGSATGGNLDLTGMNAQGHVGGDGSSSPPASTWLSEAHLSGSCLGSCAGKVWVTGGLSAAAPTQRFPADTLRAADWQDRYLNAAPGPYHSCAGGPFFDKNGVPDGLNNDLGTFNLIGSSYNCTFDSNNYISYDATTHVLRVKGTIFFDGDLTVSGSASYVGIANIYASGTVTFGTGAVLCAKLSGSTCDWSGWNPNYDASSNPNPSMLILAAYSYSGGTSVSGTNVQFQGGLYGQNSIIVGGGSPSAGIQGPLVSPGTVTIGQGAGTTFPLAGLLAPGYPLSPYKLGPLQNRTG